MEKNWGEGAIESLGKVGWGAAGLGGGGYPKLRVREGIL